MTNIATQINEMVIQSINIIGSGSMGHLWAAYLSQSSIHTRLVCRTLKTHPKINLVSPTQSFSFIPSYSKIEEWQEADLVIICVKSNDLEPLCQKLKHLSLQHSTILLMMNGMGLIEIVKHHLPNIPVFQASTSHGCYLDRNADDDDLTLHHTGIGKTLIGDLENDSIKNSQTNNIASIIQILNNALPTTDWNENHKQTLWEKLLVNCVINPLTAIHDVNNGQIISDSIIYSQTVELTKELAPLIDKVLPGKNWQYILEKVETIAKHTYTNISSMRQDIIGKRKTEIDFISGYLLKTAESFDIKLLQHCKIVNQIKKLENDYQNSVTKRG